MFYVQSVQTTVKYRDHNQKPDGLKQTSIWLIICLFQKDKENIIVSLDTHAMTDLGYTILLDRYAQKDPKGFEKLAVNDIVIAIVDNESPDGKQRREIGKVVAIDNENDLVSVEVHPHDTVIQISRRLIDRPLETSPDAIQYRVAKGIASVERPEARTMWEDEFRWLLKDWKFIPGGRILTAAGTDQNLTAFNCFVIPSPKDSRGGIMETLTNMAELMSRGGGVGINVSTLRPKNARVEGVNGRSSGAVSWGALYSYVTGLIEQAGSRRGALMLILNDWHPDVFRFISAKETAGNIVNANISVGISDAFMKAVEDDGDWTLKFPDTKYYKYDTEWNGNLEAWETSGYPVIEYNTIKARELWHAITENAWKSAEPGLWFRERANKMSNSYYYPKGQLIATNPCGEQNLPGWGICNLGAINLSEFWNEETREVKWNQLEKAASIGTRFLDNVIDWTPYHFEENEDQAKEERRIGLGIMGLAELLIKAGVRYGSNEGSAFTERIFHTIARSAYLTSAQIASEKGSFTMFYEPEFLNSGYMKLMDEDVREEIREKGIRNVTLLTVAPTGTTGTMINTSTGIEPFFSWNWWRKGRLGLFEEKAPVVQEWLTTNNIDPDSEYALPNQFVTAMELTPEEHVRMMASAQRWVDSAISKTVNVPNEYTVEQVDELYRLMYKLGCKGGTIYRDGSRTEQVLHLKKEDASGEAVEDKEAKSVDSTLLENVHFKLKDEEIARLKAEWEAMTRQPTVLKSVFVPSQAVSPEITLPKRPTRLPAVVLKGQTPYGNVFITISEDPTGTPYELFITIGKSGSDLSAQGESMGRTFSAAIQSQPNEKRLSMLKILTAQNSGIGGARQVGLGPKRVSSFPDAVAKIISDQYLAAKGVADAAQEHIDNTTWTFGTKELDQGFKQFAASGFVDLPTMSSITVEAQQEEVVLEDTVVEIASIKGANTCPQCQNQTLLRAEGCSKCVACGYSEC